MTKAREFFDKLETRPLLPESDIKRLHEQEILTQVEELTAGIIFATIILILAIL